jgi:lipoprotein-anchoring transpeptidase ErfK/SrfK
MVAAARSQGGRVRGPDATRWQRSGRCRHLPILAAGVASLAVLLAACAGEVADVTEPPAPTTGAPMPGTEEQASEEETAPEGTTPAPGEAGPEASGPTASRSLVATALVDEVEVFADADAASERTHLLTHPTERGVPRVFLVETRRDGWLEVLLPVRPNGSMGWIRTTDVELAANPYRIDVQLAAHALTIHRDDELVLETAIGYGAEDTPTPGGRYYLTELLQPPDPEGVYGPFAFGLSGFSDVHLDFAGGEGVIGIHGTNQPDSIGSTVSNGCIRVPNEVIAEMASFLPLGTPVTIS